MKRAAPSEELHEVSSGGSSSSDSDQEAGMGKGGSVSKAASAAEGALIRRAEMYQHYMKHIPVPDYRDSVIPFTSWLGLARSLKQLYKQPLHYLTNVLLKRWDQQRIGSDDEHWRLDGIIHPVRAETLIWATEEVHRLTTSGQHLASLWASDPLYHAYIDPVFPFIKLAGGSPASSTCRSADVPRKLKRMRKEQIVAVLQIGGEFTTDADGHMSYSGGEAHAMFVQSDWTFGAFKQEISSTLNNLKLDQYAFKYFLPKNDKTLISISNDKDLRRMVEFHAESETTYIYVMKKADNRLKNAIVESGTPADAFAIVPTTKDGSKRQKVCASWNNVITGVGQVFEGPKDFRDALHKYAIAHRFHYRFIKNDSSRVTAECTGEDCPWRIHASKSPAKKEFMIKKISESHTCESETVKSHRLASQRWVASVIKEKLRDSPNYRPRDIANDLQREYGLCLNYSQAWRGRSIAQRELYSSHEEACSQLPWFCERIVETNPGSVATVVALEDSKFRFFVAFHALLHGFQHRCRPLLFLDAITAKPNKHWKLLAATSVDGEGDVFPVAFGVVDDESRENWHWFLQQLKSSLSTSRAITFISNGEHGLWDEVSSVFPDSHHGYCMESLIEEFKKQLDDAWTEELKDAMVEHLKKAIYSCTVDELNQYIELIRGASDKLADWLLDIKPERWSDALFKGVRHGHYSSNIFGTVSEWIPTRYELSVVQLVDTIRCKLMEMMYTRRVSSNAWTEVLTPAANQKLQEEVSKAHTLNVLPAENDENGSDVFKVCDDSVNVVNLATWDCTCQRWRISGLPCMHAIAVIERTGQYAYDYCEKYFTTEWYRLTYAQSINPIPDVIVPTTLIDPAQSPATHPTCPVRTRRRVGRPKEKPADPRIAIKRAVRCSRCKGYGHNKTTCKVPISA